MKKILSLLLTAILLLGTCSAVAARTEEPLVKTSFEGYLDGWGLGKTIYRWYNTGKEGFCIGLVPTSKQHDISINVPLQKGETYRIEFWIRTDATEDAMISPYFDFPGDGAFYHILEKEPVGNEWKKISITTYFDGTDTKGKQVHGENARFVMRYIDPARAWYYLDEFSITPMGDIAPVVKEENTKTYEGSDDNGLEFVSFDDTDGHWAEGDITALATNGLLNGMSDDEFVPDGNVTRAEFVKMMVSGLRVNTNGYKNLFTDVEAADWFAEYIQTASNMGILPAVMCKDGKFLPDRKITREEAAAILGKVSHLKEQDGSKEVKFTDDSEIDSTLKADVESAVANNLIKGFDDGSFKPDDLLTRAQAAAMQKRVAEIDSCVTIYVDGDKGNDSNEGTYESPFKTIKKAQEEVKKYTDTMQNHIFVYLKGTEYYMADPLEFKYEDSGKNGYYIVYASYGDKQASLSGGRHVKNWSIYDADKNIYAANVGTDIETRQMFVNGTRAIRARSEEGLSGVSISPKKTGYYTTDTFLCDFKKPQDLEMVYYEIWTNPRCGVASIAMLEGGKQAEIVMEEPGWGLCRSKGDTSVDFPVYYENAYELLDEGGEWYLDTEEGMLYYKPRVYEDMSTADVILPVEEDIVSAEGSFEEPVSNIAFYNVRFDYSTWMRPSSSYGHADTQSNHIRQDNADHLIPSAVELRNIENFAFQDCTFTKLGSTALGIYGGVHNIKISGNEFYDTSATAIQLGELRGDNIVNPSEEKYAIRGAEISDNYIHDIAVDYKSGVGIATTFVKETLIEHNEIYEVPYCGMHLGYGWNEYRHLGTSTEDFVVQNNYVHETMNYLIDGGAIYTLGGRDLNFSKMNVLRENYVQNTNNAYAAIYNDNGTSGLLVERNVVNLVDVDYFYGHSDAPLMPACWALGGGGNSRHLLWRDNYTTTDYSMWDMYIEDGLKKGGEEAEFVKTNQMIDTHVCPDANWPAEAQAIIDKAGLRGKYLERFAAPVQEIRHQEKYSVKSGESVKLSLTAEGRKDTVSDFSSCELYYESLNPEIATVDENGVVTAHKQGMATVVIYVADGDMVEAFKAEVAVDNILTDIKFNTEQVVLSEGAEFKINAKGVTYLGDIIDVEGFTYAIADTAVASVDETGKVKANALGETSITVKGSVDGVTVEKALPVVVADAETDIIHNLGNDIKDISAWNSPKGTTVLDTGDGISISTPSSTVGYSDKEFLNETLHFGLEINAKPGWPSIVLRADDYKSEYKAVSCYMITLYENGFDLQRFNRNENGTSDRTVIYGSLKAYESVAGPMIEGDFAYNEKHDIKVSAKNEGDYVRIKLVIDGVEVMNYLDTDENCIREQGYMQVYCTSGTMNFTPAE